MAEENIYIDRLQKYKRALGGKPLLVLILLALLSCSPPERDNALDPLSPRYNPLSSLVGVVWSYYQPYNGIAAAAVTISPSNLQTFSDADGHFNLDNLSKAAYTVVASKNGYAPDTALIDLNTVARENVVFHLDALPTFSNTHVTSQHISRWWPTTDLYTIEIESTVQDADGPTDIERVLLFWPNASQVDTLQQVESSHHYHLMLNDKTLPIPPSDIVGLPLRLTAHDKPLNSAESDDIYLHRIVDEIPVALSPRGLDVVNSAPVLKWQATPPVFSFTFFIQLFRDDSGVISSVREKNDIPADQDSLAIDVSLNSGIYFWTVAIVDIFGNSGRSKESAFQVE